MVPFSSRNTITAETTTATPGPAYNQPFSTFSNIKPWDKEKFASKCDQTMVGFI
jgi:hypothetical protein